MQSDLEKFVIGVDFGTLSARAVLVSTADGRVLAEEAMDYPHGVMTKHLPDQTLLPPDFAIQAPEDYLAVLETVVRDVVHGAVEEADIDPAQVIGIGLDATSCTVLPADAEGMPLAFHPEFRNNPHAWVKLWKHHAAQPQADRLRELLMQADPERLQRYGNHISSEWLLPKLAETAECAPEVYQAADRFLDMPDFLTGVLTGNYVVSACGAGYKALWDKSQGYPDQSVLEGLHPLLHDAVRTKLRGRVVPLGSCVGHLTPEWAERLGLTEQTAVAAGNVDAHVSVPGAGVTKPDSLLMIMGTSTCAMLVSPVRKMISGICGIIEDGILPGYYGYEAGQPGVGDMLGWFVKSSQPSAEEGATHSLLTTRAALLAPGENHLIALDWWNGNRSILDNASLSGMILGLTLETTPEMIYRALMESTAYGMRTILEHCQANGLRIEEIYACGGISVKNSLMMQIYADVLQREIRVSPELQAPAKGAAMYGAVAAGEEAGGFSDINAAAAAMADTRYHVYQPNAQHKEVYDRLYHMYRELHDQFGIHARGFMQELREVTYK